MKHAQPYHVWYRMVAESYDLQRIKHRTAGGTAAPILEDRLRPGLAEDYNTGREPEEVASDLVHGRHAVINPQPVQA